MITQELKFSLSTFVTDAMHSMNVMKKNLIIIDNELSNNKLKIILLLLLLVYVNIKICQHIEVKNKTYDQR